MGEGQEAGEQLDGNEVRVGDVEGLTAPVTAPTMPIGTMPSDTDGSIIGQAGLSWTEPNSPCRKCTPAVHLPVWLGTYCIAAPKT